MHLKKRLKDLVSVERVLQRALSDIALNWWDKPTQCPYSIHWKVTWLQAFGLTGFPGNLCGAERIGNLEKNEARRKEETTGGAPFP